MASPTSPLIDIPSITTMHDVIDNLQQLDGLLRELQLNQFKLFNAAYLVVTHNISKAIADDYFTNPKFIEAFIVMFADYYFRAVNDTVSDSAHLSPPWSKLNDYAADKSLPVFISLMLGANAHINNDLPQVLERMMHDQEAPDLLGDMFKIDRLLMKSGKQIIGLFEEQSTFLNFLKNRLQFTYYRPAMYTILYWRISAWKNYQRLKKDDTSPSHISNRSTKIANRILRIAKVLA